MFAVTLLSYQWNNKSRFPRLPQGFRVGVLAIYPFTRKRENISAVKAAPSVRPFVKIVEKSNGGVDIHTLTVRRVFF